MILLPHYILPLHYSTGYRERKKKKINIRQYTYIFFPLSKYVFRHIEGRGAGTFESGMEAKEVCIFQYLRLYFKSSLILTLIECGTKIAFQLVNERVLS